jgi:hypothetical protein
MRLFVDACVPDPTTQTVRHIVLGKHEVRSARELDWHGKPDAALLRDVAARGFEAFLTADLRQLDDPVETKAIQRSGLHHIRIPSVDGRKGLGLMIGVVTAAILPLLDTLSKVDSQRLVLLKTPREAGRFYDIVDPRRTADAPKYWPR